MLSKIKKVYKNSLIFKKIDEIENKHYQKNLKNTEFTLLCPNCIGGLIYHRLGERFNSPTIDLTIDTVDFCNFLEYLDYYIEQPVYQSDSLENGTPVGIIKGNENIPDIKIFFTHYHTFEEGKSKWEQRKTRIIKDNMYVILYDIENLTEENPDKAGFINEKSLLQFENFKCNNKVLLTRNKNNSKPYAHYIEPNYNGPFPLVYLNRDITGLMPYEKKFDFVSFINQK